MWCGVGLYHSSLGVVVFFGLPPRVAVTLTTVHICFAGGEGLCVALCRPLASTSLHVIIFCVTWLGALVPFISALLRVAVGVAKGRFSIVSCKCCVCANDDVGAAGGGAMPPCQALDVPTTGVKVQVLAPRAMGPRASLCVHVNPSFVVWVIDLVGGSTKFPQGNLQNKT